MAGLSAPKLRRAPAAEAAAIALALLLAAALACRSGEWGPPRPEGAPADIPRLAKRDDLNLVFVLIDTLRADRLSSYGYERRTSPVMDALAERGVRFAHVLSQSSWTKCSMASLWTGTYPATSGVTRWADALPEAATTPAEILREAGFRTAGIFRNGWVAPKFGFRQGFDLYVRPRPGRRPAALAGENPSARPLAGSDLDVTESAIEFLRSSGDERFFLYLHYMDVHQYVYDERSAKFGTSYSDIYDNSIHWVDLNLSGLVAALKERGLFDETLLVIAGDHGEAFYEHGLEGHARNVYGEVVETPLVLSLPFRLEPGIVVEERVANVDLWPTLLELLGLPALPGAQGRSRVSLIEAAARGAAPAAEETAFAQLDRTWARQGAEPDPLVAVAKGRFRLIHRATAPERDELFDHAADPREQRNVRGQHPEVTEALRAEAGAYLERSTPPWGKAEQVDVDAAELGRLRALGYVLEDEGPEEASKRPRR